MTDQTIQGVITQAQASIKSAISKIQNAPAYAVDGPIQVPTSIAFAQNIRMAQISGGFKITLFDLVIQVMTTGGTGESAMTWLADIPQSVGNIFRSDPTVNGTCQTYGGGAGDITAKMIIDDAKNSLGYEITVPDVKISG